MQGRGVIGLGLAVLVAFAGCGSSSPDRASSSRAASARTTPTTAARTAAVVVTGTPVEQIVKTIQTFYRATADGDGGGACGLFTARGRAGLIATATKALPRVVTRQSTCPHVIETFGQAVNDSFDSVRGDGVTLPKKPLQSVRVAQVRIRGASASAIAPVGLEIVIAPKVIRLRRVAGRWRIDGSRNLRR